ncbi:MAG: M23 family metallopeptidase [Henriciella sp.]
MWGRGHILALILAPLSIGQAAADTDSRCWGQAVQGGLLLCKAAPDSVVSVIADNQILQTGIPVSADGVATIGIKRNSPLELTITSTDIDSVPAVITIGERDDPVRYLSGLDCDKIDARTDAQKAHAGRSWVKKTNAFSQFEQGDGARNGFRRPADGPESSPFGPVRQYIGTGANGETCESQSVHRGYDIAVGVGTPVTAPAAGIITLGDPDLYYEGGTVFLDHGAGLISVFMHLDEVIASPGDYVEAGQLIARSGNTGRTTGPHLHWAVKWRNAGSSDRGGDFYIDPALLLSLDPNG